MLLLLSSSCSSDINECLQDNAGCSQLAACINAVGTFHCVCDDGFEGNGFVCHGTKFIGCLSFSLTQLIVAHMRLAAVVFIILVDRICI